MRDLVLPSCLPELSKLFDAMNIPSHMSRLKGFRYPRETIAYDVWAHH